MSIESQVQTLFHEEGILVSCTDRPWYNNPAGAETMHGIEVHKNDVDFVSTQLTRLGVEYNILDGRFKNTKGCWSHKSFKFLELPNHKEAYKASIEGGIL